MNRTGITLAAAVLAVLALVNVPGRAHAEDTPVLVQLAPNAMPAVTDKGYRGRITLTAYVKVKNADVVERFCARLPRFVDALLVALEEAPVQLADVATHIAERQGEFRAITAATVGTGVFEALYLVQGSKDPGEGTERIDIAGAGRGCVPIAALPEDVKIAATPAPKPAPPPVDASPPASTIPLQSVAPSPLSKEELDRAFAELEAEQPPPRKPFPGEPEMPGSKPKPQIMMAIVLVGLGGIMMVIGSYIGYQVAKIRRERRRRDRRKAVRDRRAGIERRNRNDGAPVDGERRSGEDRRKSGDRRKAQDRRARRDRRDDAPASDEAEQPGVADGPERPDAPQERDKPLES